jgi:hypothetical protein
MIRQRARTARGTEELSKGDLFPSLPLSALRISFSLSGSRNEDTHTTITLVMIFSTKLQLDKLGDHVPATPVSREKGAWVPPSSFVSTLTLGQAVPGRATMPGYTFPLHGRAGGPQGWGFLSHPPICWEGGRTKRERGCMGPLMAPWTVTNDALGPQCTKNGANDTCHRPWRQDTEECSLVAMAAAFVL